MVAVIPTVIVSTPFAFLCWLFPVTAGTLAVWARSRLVLLVVLSLTSTLYLLYAWFGGWFRGVLHLDVWGLWAIMAAVTLTGLVWSWRRRGRYGPVTPEQVASAGRREKMFLSAISLAGVVYAVWCLIDGRWNPPPWRDFLALCSVPWSGTLFLLMWNKSPWRSIAEMVMLGSFTLACVLVALVSARPPVPSNAPFLVWTFEPAERGAIVATPLVHGDHVIVPVVRDTNPPSGAVYCLRADTGKVVWRFDDGSKMQHMISSPCVADGRLFLGEGMHANYVCKFYCLDVETGRKLWHATTSGHIESSPCVADGHVFVGAGDDGLYCFDAQSGSIRWHFTGRFHIDSSPIVVDGRVFFGSGISRTRKTPAAICLDAATGNVLWTTPTDLPVWGSPAVMGDCAYFGLGNGRLGESAAAPERPAGALWCLDSKSGRQRWRFDVADSVFARPLVDNQHIWFVSRDRCCYCLDRASGSLLWKQDLGSAAVTTPHKVGERLYVVATSGRIGCLNPASGERIWTLDLDAYTQTRPRLFSSPVVGIDPAGGRRIYLGTELRTGFSSAAVLYCWRD